MASVYDPRRGEVIDAIDGEVLESRSIDMGYEFRAFSYEDWKEKNHYYPAIFLDKDAEKLWARIWSVGRRIGAPKVLMEEAFKFYRKSWELRSRPEFRGRYVGLTEKCVLAVYYVLAKRLGYDAIAQAIASMPCSENSVCYANRKHGDREFKRCLKVVLRYAAYIVPNHDRDPVAAVEKFMRKHPEIPEFVHREAKIVAERIRNYIAGRRMETVLALCYKIACEKTMRDPKRLVDYIHRELKVSQAAVQNFEKYLQQVGVLKRLLD